MTVETLTQTQELIPLRANTIHEYWRSMRHSARLEFFTITAGQIAEVVREKSIEIAASTNGDTPSIQSPNTVRFLIEWMEPGKIVASRLHRVLDDGSIEVERSVNNQRVILSSDTEIVAIVLRESYSPLSVSNALESAEHQNHS